MAYRSLVSAFVQVWLAYCLDQPLPPGALERRLSRVERYHDALCRESLTMRGWAGARLGSLIWDEPQPPCRWPVWCAEDDIAVTTVYAPLGWQQVVGNLPPAAAAPALARRLLADPTEVCDLCPPFILAIHDRASGSMSLINDGAGLARFYELRVAQGWVWSNRLSALSLFSEVDPQASTSGWSTLCAGGWFMGDRTALQGARAVGPSARITVWEDSRWPRSVEGTGAISRWVAPRGPERLDVAGVAEQMRTVAESVGLLWDQDPTVQLSGGRDSRTVAAAVVASGIEASFHTVGTLQGELDIAEQLVAKAPRPLVHRVTHQRDVTTTGDLRERTLALHRAYDGHYGPGGIKQSKWRAFASRKAAVFGGAGGEIARGSYYRLDLDRIRARGESGPMKRLEGLYRVLGGVHEEAHAPVRAQIERTLEEGRRQGIEGASLLDYFYLSERLRRWANTSARFGTVALLASPRFVRGAFDLTPDQRIADHLTNEVVGELVPGWRDVAFYKASPSDARRSPRPRLWQTSDAKVFEELLASPELWDDLFQPEEVRRLWDIALAGDGGNAHESVFERLAWRAFYHEHLQELRRAIADAPAPVALAVSTVPSDSSLEVTHRADTRTAPT